MIETGASQPVPPVRSHVLVVALVHRPVRDHGTVRVRQAFVVVGPSRALGALEPERDLPGEDVPDPNPAGFVAADNLIESPVPERGDAPALVPRVRLR